MVTRKKIEVINLENKSVENISLSEEFYVKEIQILLQSC